MSNFGSVYLKNESGVPYGVKHVNNKPRVSAMDYLYDIAEGNVANHEVWTKIGFNGALVADTEADLWSATGSYVWPTAGGKWEVVSSSAGDEDAGTVLKTATADAGGSTTTLVDADGDFVVAGIAAGDCLILDKAGTTPEYGYITTVAATTLTCSGGFSSGGVGTSRGYHVIDADAAGKTGVHAVIIKYLTDAFAEKSEIVILDGNAAVDTVNTDLYRVNSFRAIAVGSTLAAVGNLTLRADGAGATYSYITAKFTRARNCCYTVPTGKVLYITQFSVGYGYKTNTTHFCRVYTRARQNDGFRTTMFFPFTEVIVSNNDSPIVLTAPIKILSGVDIKVSALATYAGQATVALRGWIETA